MSDSLLQVNYFSPDVSWVGLHDLRYKANILHRDVSVDNVMYEYRDGRVHFVLIDFDMATVLPTGEGGSYVPTSRHRTGTLPFMAVDLIEDASNSAKKGYIPIAHRLCHDFESVFWLCVWCTMIMLSSGLEEIQLEDNLAIVRAWETAELKAIAYTKMGIRARPLPMAGFVVSSVAVEAGLEDWFAEWTNIWVTVEGVLAAYHVAAYKARCCKLPPPDFDFETIGGTLTQTKMKEALTIAFPEDQTLTLPPADILDMASTATLRLQ